MKHSKATLSGQQLVADFQSAFIALATSQVAHQEAARSESELMQQLSYWSRGGYLQPGTIDGTGQADVSRASLDAHIKKMQAEQVEAMKNAHLDSLIQDNKLIYTGQKVTVDVVGASESPIDVLWFNPHSGYRSNPFPKKHVSGVITEVALDKNLLLVRPGKMTTIINPELQCYVVYVIHPATAEPMVSLSFSS